MAKTTPTDAPATADDMLAAATSAPAAAPVAPAATPVVERDESKLNSVRTDAEGRSWVKYQALNEQTGELEWLEREVIEPTEAEMAAARRGNITHTYEDGSARVGQPPFPVESPLQAQARQLREQAEASDHSLIGLAERQQRTPEQMGIVTASSVNQTR